MNDLHLQPPAPSPAPKRRGWFAPLNPPLADWTGRRVWLLGASTGIGRAVADALHAQGAQVIVSARGESALQSLAASHPGLQVRALDATDGDAVARIAADIAQAGGIDCAVYCAGYYRAQRASAFDLQEMLRHEQVNYTGALHMLAAVLPPMLARGSGHISLVSSVAGYRGLPNGLAYGPTKAALINLAETLYIDLQDHGIGVSLINPGFVETPLTAQNEFEMPALISPQQAADAILQGWREGRFEIHFPKRFTLGVKLLGLLPFRFYQAAVRRITGL
ncbi:MAG: SDR family NAD(P)-dependent oxidoreductase [Ramlibacter sp.]|jgi:short-subunit dehydrogenase